MVPPRSAVTTLMPASTGPSTTVDHSSALKSAFFVISAPLARRLGSAGSLTQPASLVTRAQGLVLLAQSFRLGVERLEPGVAALLLHRGLGAGGGLATRLAPALLLLCRALLLLLGRAPCPLALLVCLLAGLATA